MYELLRSLRVHQMDRDLDVPPNPSNPGIASFCKDINLDGRGLLIIEVIFLSVLRQYLRVSCRECSKMRVRLIFLSVLRTSLAQREAIRNQSPWVCSGTL